jgi:hypothetical protein
MASVMTTAAARDPSVEAVSPEFAITAAVSLPAINRTTHTAAAGR